MEMVVIQLESLLSKEASALASLNVDLLNNTVEHTASTTLALLTPKPCKLTEAGVSIQEIQMEVSE